MLVHYNPHLNLAGFFWTFLFIRAIIWVEKFNLKQIIIIIIIITNNLIERTQKIPCNSYQQLHSHSHEDEQQPCWEQPENIIQLHECCKTKEFKSNCVDNNYNTVYSSLILGEQYHQFYSSIKRKKTELFTVNWT